MYLTQGLRRARQIRPEGISTVFRDRQRTWTETVERVARVAGGLKALGVRPGDRVAILALNSDRYYELLYAIPWLGAVMVPVNTRLAPSEIAYILEDSGARVLFVDGATKGHAAALAGTIPSVEAILYLDDDEPPAGLRRYEDLAAAPAAEDAGAGGDTLAGLFYTGGTTGKSKGVMLSHNNLVWNAMNAVAGLFLDGDTVYIHSGPMFHLADGASTFGVTACAGRHAFVPRFDPVDCFETIQRERVTHGQYVPTMINMLANHPGVKDYDLSSLKYILYGASPMPEGVLRKALDVLPVCAFIHAYGMLGYWNKPKETAAVLENGWYYSGDAAYMDDEGFLFIVDRLKDMIISGGENVYSAEVENTISLLPGVAEVAVIGIPDAKWGETIHAIIVPRAGIDLTAEAVTAHCRKQIAGYKCPRSVEFRDTPLPVSGAGKILKRELRELFWRGYEKRVN